MCLVLSQLACAWLLSMWAAVWRGGLPLPGVPVGQAPPYKSEPRTDVPVCCPALPPTTPPLQDD